MAIKKRYSGEIPRIPVDADTSAADQKLDYLFNRIDGLKHVGVDADVSQLQRKLNTLIKRTNSQLSADLVNTMLKDFKTVLGAAKTEFETRGETSIFKGLQKTCDMVEDRFANLTISIDTKKISGLDNILNAVDEIHEISDFSLGEVVSLQSVKNTESVLSNIREAKKEITAIAGKADYIRKALDGNSESVLSIKQLNKYHKKLEDITNSLEKFSGIDDELVQGALTHATNKINDVLGEVEIRLAAPKVTDDTATVNETLKSLGAIEKKDKAIQEVKSRISKNSSINGLKDLDQEAVNVTKTLSEMYDEGIRDTERYITLQYKLDKIFKKIGERYKGNGHKNRSELLEWIVDGISQRTGVDIFHDSGYAGVMENLFGNSDFSLFNQSLSTLKMQDIAELLLIAGKTGDWVDVQRQMAEVVEQTEAAQTEVTSGVDQTTDALKKEKDKMQEVADVFASTEEIMTKSANKYLGKNWKGEIFNTTTSEEAAKVLSEIDDQIKLIENDAHKAKLEYDALNTAILSYTGHNIRSKSEFIKAIKDAWSRDEKEAATKLFSNYQKRFPDGKFDPDKTFGDEWTKNYTQNLEAANRSLSIWRGGVKAAAEEYGKFFAYQELTKGYNPAAGTMGFRYMAESHLFELQEKENAAVVASERATNLLEQAQNRFATDDVVTAQKNLNAAIDEYNEKLAVSNSLWQEKIRLENLDSFEDEPWYNDYDVPATKIMEVARQLEAAENAANDFKVALKEAVRVYRELGGDMKLPFGDEGLLKEIDIPVKQLKKAVEARLKLTPKKEGNYTVPETYTALEGKYEVSKGNNGWDVYQRDSIGMYNFIKNYSSKKAIEEDTSLLTREEIIVTEEAAKAVEEFKAAYQALPENIRKVDVVCQEYVRLMSDVKNSTIGAANALEQLNKFAESKGLVAPVNNAAQEKMSKTVALIGKLQEQYGVEKFTEIFGDIGTVDVSNAESVYDALIAKEKEYGQMLVNRANTITEFTTQNSELIGQFSGTDNWNAVETKVGEISAGIYESGLSLEEANKQLKEFVDTLSEATENKNKLFESPRNNYEKLFNTLASGDNAFETKSKGDVSGYSWADRENIAEAIRNGLQQGLTEINVVLNNGKSRITINGIEGAAKVLDALGFKAIESEITKFIGKAFKKGQNVKYSNANGESWVTNPNSAYRLSRPLNEEEYKGFASYMEANFASILEGAKNATAALPGNVREAIVPNLGGKTSGEKCYIFRTDEGQYITIKKSEFDNLKKISSSMAFNPNMFKNGVYKHPVYGFGQDGSTVAATMPINKAFSDEEFNSFAPAPKNLLVANKNPLNLAGIIESRKETEKLIETQTDVSAVAETTIEANKKLTSSYTGLAEAVEKYVESSKKMWAAYDNGEDYVQLVNERNIAAKQIASLFPSDDTFGMSATRTQSGMSIYLQDAFTSKEYGKQGAEKALRDIENHLELASKEIAELEEKSAAIEKENKLLEEQKNRLHDIFEIASTNKNRDFKKDQPHGVDALRQRIDELEVLVPQLKELQTEITQMNIEDDSPNFKSSFATAGALAEAIKNKEDDLAFYNNQLETTIKLEEFAAQAHEKYGISIRSKKFDDGIMGQFKELIVGLQNGLTVGDAMSQLDDAMMAWTQSKEEQTRLAQEAAEQTENQLKSEEKLADAARKTADETEKQASAGKKFTNTLSDLINNEGDAKEIERLFDPDVKNMIKNIQHAAQEGKVAFLQNIANSQELTGALTGLFRDAYQEIGDYKFRGKYPFEYDGLDKATIHLISKDESKTLDYILKMEDGLLKVDRAKQKIGTTKFNVAHEVSLANAEVDKLVAKLNGRQLDGLQNLRDLANSIVDSDSLKEFENELDVLSKKAATLSSKASSTRGFNPLTNSVYEMDNASITIDTYTERLKRLGDVKGVSDAAKQLDEMASAARRFENATSQTEEEAAFSDYQKAKSKYDAYYEYAKEAKKSADAEAKQVNVEEQKIQQYYQEILNTVNKINELDKEIEQAKGKNKTGAFSEFINKTQAEKSQLISDVKSTLAEVSGLFGGGILGQNISMSGARFFSQEDTNNLNAFLQSAQVQTALAQGDVNKLSECLGQLSKAFANSEKIGAQAAETIRSSLQKVSELGQKLFKFNDAGRVSDSNDLNNKTKLFNDALKTYRALQDVHSQIGDKPVTDWTAEETVIVQKLSEEFIELGTQIDNARQKEERYFSDKTKHNDGDTANAIVQYSKEHARSMDQSQKKLEETARKFVTDSGLGNAMITNFTRGADGISKLDFSVFDSATGSLRNFRMEMGSVTKGIYRSETTITKSLSNIQAAKKQLDSTDNLLGRLKASGVNTTEGSASAQVAKLLNASKQLFDEVSKGDKADQNKIIQYTKDLQLMSKEVEKVDGQMRKMESAIESGSAKRTSNIDPNGNIYRQLVNEAQKLAEMQGNVTLETGKFDKATNTLNFSLTHANGTVEQLKMSMYGLDGQVAYQQTGVTKLTTSWDRFKASIGSVGKQLLTAFAGYNVFYKAIAEVRKGIGYVKDIDLALTELKKVTDETEESYAKFLNTMSAYGSEISATVSELTTSAADWARLGLIISLAPLYSNI